MMASLDKLPPTTRYSKGRYKVRYKKPDGTAGSKNFVRREEAVRFQQSNEADIDRGDWIDPKARRSKFDSWAASYERSLVRLAPSTSRRYGQYLHNQVLPFFAGRAIASIDYQDVEDFIADLFEKKDASGNSALSPKSVRDALSVLSQVMKAALKARAIRVNPAADHHIRVPKQRGQVLTLEQLLEMVESVPENYWMYRSALLLLIYTGLRPAELCGLRVSRLDILKGFAHICETLTEVGGRLIVGPTKTDQERIVPLPEFLCEVLAEHLAWRSERLQRPLQPDDYVWTAVKGGGLSSKKLRAAIVIPALQRAGLPPDFRTYDLRHSHASQIIDMGASALVVKERLGHGDVLTTMRKYGHLFEGVQRRLATDLNAAHAEAAAARRQKGEVVKIDSHREDRP
jgi:integrase